MNSRRVEQQATIRRKVMRLIYVKPEMSTWRASAEFGVSNGSAYYVLTALVEKGFVELDNFKNNLSKGWGACKLPRKGVIKKFLLTQSFVECKRQEFEGLRAEIQALEQEANLASASCPGSKQW